MLRERFAQIVRNPKYQPFLIGLPIGIVLAFVFSELAAQEHPLALMCFGIWILLCTFPIRHRLYYALTTAWFIGAFFAFVFWKP